MNEVGESDSRSVRGHTGISSNIEHKKKNYKKYPMSKKKLLLKIFMMAPMSLTASIRVLPDFLIIGAQKCGTSSLYFNLCRHPQIRPAFTKEVHFFDNNFDKGAIWYRKHFHTTLYKKTAEKINGEKIITGESSPAYLFNPNVPARVKELMPGTKLIVCLRNPVDRAYSHYNHYKRQGLENLSFQDAIDKEEERLKGEFDKILADKNYYSFNYNHYSYKARGIYIEQLMRWMEIFPRSQILVIRIEDYYNNPDAEYKKVLDFMNIKNWSFPRYRKYNYGGGYIKMEESIRKKLVDFFRPYNQRLYDLLGRNLMWDK